MKSFTISLVLLFMPINSAQINSVKQITDYEFDSTNPFILSSNYLNGELFFEGRQDSAVNIFSIKYNSAADTFNQLSQITSNAYINKNATGAYVYNYPSNDYKIILWETNQNGNWDIAFSVDSGNGWTAPELFLNSDEDENNPSFAFYPFYYFQNNNAYKVIYTKGNSIQLYNKDTIITEEVLFEGNDTLKYSNPVYTDAWDYAIAACERRVNGGDPYIVYRQKFFQDTEWNEIKEAFHSAPAINPKLIFGAGGAEEGEYVFALSFEIFFDGKRKFVWINLNDLGSSNTIHELLDDQNLETSDFFTLYLPVLKTKDYFDPYNPYSFRYARNDSTFIRSSTNNIGDVSYGDFYTRVKEPHSVLGVMGDNQYIISYTIWEDSANGKINLFGIKTLNYSGDVKKEISPEGFSLSQNFPNPFNPNTKIQYAVGNPANGTGRQFVTLKVFDLLGREVTNLVNEEKSPGLYEVELNAAGLSSGIYFYQLKSGSYVQTKKLVLLK